MPLPATDKAVGVDVGVTVAAALSDGTVIENPRHLARSADALTAAQRLVAGRRRGSKRRGNAIEAVAAIHRQIARQRGDFLHKQSRALINDHGLIVIEDLPIDNMVRRPKPIPDTDGGHHVNGASAKAGLNKSILDVGWGKFRAMLAYKAEEAGRQLVVVNPRHSSQLCAHCGHLDGNNRRGSVFRCVGCGHRDHADVNAAVNILRAGQALRRAREAEPTVA
jgi:putative transposase